MLGIRDLLPLITPFEWDWIVSAAGGGGSSGGGGGYSGGYGNGGGVDGDGAMGR